MLFTENRELHRDASQQLPLRFLATGCDAAGSKKVDSINRSKAATMSNDESQKCFHCGSLVGTTAKFCSECGSPQHPVQMPMSPPQSLRKSVTVLFADLKGSTHAISAVDAETAMLRLRPLVSTMAIVVRECGGTVLEIRGDGIFASFGAVDPTEAHALAACRTATEIKRRIKEAGKPGLPVRLGIHTGDVVVVFDTSGTCGLSGSTVHLASRLEQAAEPNTIFISGDTYGAVAKHVDARPRGRLSFKGFSLPTETWELLDVGHHSRWQARTILGLSPFMGRDRSLFAIRAVLEEALLGRGGVACLTGQAGTGKSRLIHEALTPELLGAASLWEAHTELPARHSPYAVARTLARQWLGLTDHSGRSDVDERLRNVLKQFGEPLNQYDLSLRALLNLDVSGTSWADFDPLRRKTLLSSCFNTLCHLQAANRTLIIVIDDLQWCDEESLQLLVALAPEISQQSLALVVAARPTPELDLKACFPDATHIELKEFTQEETEVFLDAALGSDESLRPIKTHLVEWTGGLQFFLEESVRHLALNGVISGAVGDYRYSGSLDRISVPDSIHAMIASRIAYLPAAVTNTLIAGAVAGKRFPLNLLSKITDLPDALVQEHVDLLIKQNILSVAEEISGTFCVFRHDFLRDAAYEMALQDVRRHLHIRTLRAAEHLFDNRLPDWLGFLAYHATRASLHVEGLRYSWLAAQQAVISSSYKAALEFCERGLAHIDNLPRTMEHLEASIDLRLLLRVAIGATADIGASLRHLDKAIHLAEEIGDMPRRLLATIHKIWTLNFGGSAVDAAQSGRAALDLAIALNIPQSEVLARFAYGQALVAGGDYKRASEVLSPAINWLSAGHESESIGTTGTTLVLCLMMRCHALAVMGRFEEARADCAQMRDLAERTRRVYDDISLSYAQGAIALNEGAFNDALPALERGFDLCRASGNNLFLPLVASALGITLIALGKREQASEPLAASAETAELLGHRVLRLNAGATLAALRLAEGKLGEAIQLAGEARAASRESGHRGVEMLATRILAQSFIALEPKEFERPLHLLREATHLAETIEALPAMLGMQYIMVSLLVKCGQIVEAREYCGRAIEIAEKVGMSSHKVRFMSFLKYGVPSSIAKR
jgi:class 3 adenylate cyclase/tetratricopeptide (TPR) repeat protein